MVARTSSLLVILPPPLMLVTPALPVPGTHVMLWQIVMKVAARVKATQLHCTASLYRVKS